MVDGRAQSPVQAKQLSECKEVAGTDNMIEQNSCCAKTVKAMHIGKLA
jgi:hypothetical protein